ncbi:MAG: VCBS repeat-containing protein [Deltaproteobacteria bacterium]|nr:VCBS repeat-containing protein [Deltaproteobacteria bacterium]
MKSRSTIALLALVVSIGGACSSEDGTAGPPPGNGYDAGIEGGKDGPGNDSPIVVTDGSGQDAAGCPSQVLCGTQGTCCPVGTECVFGTCVAACASGVRCATACCNAGDVCVSGQCKTPTTDCIDSVDCTQSEFCDPLAKKCVEQVPGGPVCEIPHPVAALAPVLKWSWTKPDILPDYDQTISAPLIVDATGDGIPDVFVTTGSKGLTNLDNPGYMRLLDGATGKEKWAANVDALQPGNQVQVTASPAVADLDGDGKVEVITLAAARDVIAFHADGALAWRSTRPDTSPYTFSVGFTWGSAVSVADMDGDGKGEVVLAGVIFGSDGVMISGDGKETTGGSTALGSHIGTSSIIADVDGDGKQELVGGNGAYRLDGTAVWEDASSPEGFPAIADFDKDGNPELVVAAASSILVLDAKTGAELATLATPGSVPGPPVIADFDGDGTPEIGLQFYSPCEVSVFEYDAAAKALSVKWTTPMIACSGYLTPTAFDFNGDGEVEVLAHDDCHVNVMKGTTGEIQLKIAASHNTWTEFVSVADVDGDKEADLLFSANDAWNGGLLDWANYCKYTAPDTWSHGVFVYHQPREWMPTRRVWNQQSYHITNIKADGTLPKPESASWGPSGYNNYRVSAQGKGAPLAPNLILSLSVSLSACPGQVRLLAQVQNAGSIGVAPGVEVAFFEGKSPNGKPLGTAKTTKVLFPGASEIVELKTPAPAGTGSYYAIVDPAPPPSGTIAECKEDDNEASVDGVTCTKLY